MTQSSLPHRVEINPERMIRLLVLCCSILIAQSSLSQVYVHLGYQQSEIKLGPASRGSLITSPYNTHGGVYSTGIGMHLPLRKEALVKLNFGSEFRLGSYSFVGTRTTRGFQRSVYGFDQDNFSFEAITSEPLDDYKAKVRQFTVAMPVMVNFRITKSSQGRDVRFGVGLYGEVLLGGRGSFSGTIFKGSDSEQNISGNYKLQTQGEITNLLEVGYYYQEMYGVVDVTTTNENVNVGFLDTGYNKFGGGLAFQIDVPIEEKWNVVLDARLTLDDTVDFVTPDSRRFSLGVLAKYSF